MGRKREKGKARKAKAAAAQLATQQVSLNERASAQHAMVGSQEWEWRIWAMVGLTQGCNHGCPVLPAPNHAVSYFMNDVWAHACAKKSYKYTIDNFHLVWDISTNRKLAVGILLAAGTNIILDIDDIRIKLAGRLAMTIFILGEYNGTGKDDFALAVCKANLLAGDVNSGGEREIIRFYLKRISCTCLNAKYSLIKKLLPTRISGCFTCKQVKVRSLMMLCGRCKVRQYCCEECQAAEWPNHKTICRRIGRYLEMESYVPPSDLDDNDDDDEHSDDDDSVGMKKVKYPNALQWNQSSLFHYSNATRNDVKMANPTATFGEIARIISHHFQALSEEERAYWDEKAAQDKIEYTMFEARLTQGRVFKQLIEALKDLVQEANIDCSDDELSIQAMDSSHVALVAVKLRSGGFDHFRCDRPISLGFNATIMCKILECAGNDDIITLKAKDDGDSLALVFESPEQDRITDFELKLMDIDSEKLEIPDMEYKCTISMPSGKFQRIIRDMQVLCENITISCTKEGVKFGVTGDLGAGNVLIRQNSTADKDEDRVMIDMQEPVELTLALPYLNFFTNATSLGPTVILSMSPEVPLVVEYPIGETGYIKYYLAPMTDEDEDQVASFLFS